MISVARPSPRALIVTCGLAVILAGCGSEGAPGSSAPVPRYIIDTVAGTGVPGEPLEWLDSSGPLATLTPLGDAPGVLVVGTPINCNQPTYYHINKLNSSDSEFPSDAVVTWCTNP